MSDMSRSQLCSVWNMELDFWMNKIQDRTQSWRSLLFKVFYCVCHIFSCILTNKFIKRKKKTWKKISKQKKKLKAWILLIQTHTKKQMCAAALRHRFFFFFLPKHITHVTHWLWKNTLRGVEWVHDLFLFPLVLGKMKLPHAKLGLFCVV